MGEEISGGREEGRKNSDNCNRDKAKTRIWFACHMV
jgi:hypothetical protein